MQVNGEIRVPGDKSISHRVLMLAALAEGESRLHGILRSADIEATARVLRAMDADIPTLADEIVVQGKGLRGLGQPASDLDCGNSGTTTRLVAGIVAGAALRARFVGDESLSRRPMRRVARPLEAMGASVTLENGDGLPMQVAGAWLHTIDWTTEVPSAQVKSAVLLAALTSGVPVIVRERARTRDHTERLLGAMGAPVEGAGAAVALVPVDRLAPLDMHVPGDPSSAAYFVALATLAREGEVLIADVCVNDTRTGFLSALRAMGASFDVRLAPATGGEPVGSIVARPAALRGIAVAERDVPAMIDELPLLACLAARAEGETVITGAAELRVKESDRIATVVANLRALGVEADELGDGMRIVGNDAPLRGRVRTLGDHRIAMAFGVLASLPGSAIDIDDRACVAVSYPGFWDDLDRARH